MAKQPNKGSSSPKQDTKRKLFEFKLTRVDVETDYQNDSYDMSQFNDFENTSYINSINFDIQPQENKITVKVHFAVYCQQGTERVRIIEVGVDNEFSVRDLQSIATQESNRYVIPDAAILKLAQESLSQSRGVHAFLLKGKPLEGFYIPFEDVKKYIDKGVVTKTE